MLKMPIANIKDTTNSDDNSQDASNSHNDDNTIRPHSLLQQRKLTNTKREEIKRREKHH